MAEESVLEKLNELTQGKGPEKCIDAVGLEAHAAHTLVDSEDSDEGHTFEPMPALVVTIGGEELPLVIGEKADGTGALN